MWWVTLGSDMNEGRAHSDGLSGRTGIMRSAAAVSTTGYAKALGRGAPGVLLKVK